MIEIDFVMNGHPGSGRRVSTSALRTMSPMWLGLAVTCRSISWSGWASRQAGHEVRQVGDPGAEDERQAGISGTVQVITEDDIVVTIITR